MRVVVVERVIAVLAPVLLVLVEQGVAVRVVEQVLLLKTELRELPIQAAVEVVVQITLVLVRLAAAV